jgi:hypothetical protein
MAAAGVASAAGGLDRDLDSKPAKTPVDDSQK